MPGKHSRNDDSAQERFARKGAGRPSLRGSALTSVRVGDLAQTCATPRGRSSWLLRSLAILLLVAALVGGGVFIYASDILAVKEVRVSGITHLTAEEISTLAAVPASSTLLRVDSDAIEQRLKANSWVENAEVRRVFPNTLELVVTERTIAAVVEVTSVAEQKVESWAISRDGFWLMLIPPVDSEEAAGLSAHIYEDAQRVLHITDVPLDVHPEVGTVCSDEAVLNALAIVSGFTTTLADQVVLVSATDTANTILTLENGIQIAFGTADDIRSKERVCLKLMEEHPDQISYINVRVVERPTWRAVSTW